MNMTDIKGKAKELGVQIGKLRKADLIRAIQDKEGNFPCFETAKDYCSEKACCWRDACLPSKKTIKSWEKKKKIYTKKLDTELTNLKKKVKAFEKKATKMTAKAKKEAQADIKKLNKMITTLTKNIKKYTTASEDAWKIAKKGMDDAWTDLSKAYKKASKKFA